jgi:thiol-disulfide isomerase/thioredoxin
MEGNSLSSGTESTLIGKPAPEVKLSLLDGRQFRLSECKGQIVVLDFWATWCAPCMQTMPLVEEAIAQYDSDRVRLVSVNLEEPAEQIRSVLERHDLGVTVALDQDGVAAQRYQARAIPQLVIVGPDGTVERLFVGGGSGIVEQMKSSIDSLLEEPSS